MSNINSLQISFVAMTCLLAVATASPNGYYGRYNGGYYGKPSAYQYGSMYSGYNGYKPFTAFRTAPTTAAPATSAFADFFGYNQPLTDDAKQLISAGAPRLTQAMAKLNELSNQLPTYLQNVSPQTKADINKVNEIVNNVCARAMTEINPSAYSMYTPSGLKEMCDYIAKVGNDIVAGLDNPAIFQKYTSDLQTAVTALNGNAADLVL